MFCLSMLLAASWHGDAVVIGIHVAIVIIFSVLDTFVVRAVVLSMAENVACRRNGGHNSGHDAFQWRGCLGSESRLELEGHLGGDVFRTAVPRRF